ncbi:LPS assembly lipoprotein LptE [Propionivibrio sp.]|uniref:LPS-assembly lipoprotein LptE n=1 Tax=Propionivibrio sp. TaxID=2212460 RepID=UPI002634EDD8|nr:LPS assembly lipoprotein LptE [Propionivibrio sp.]
MRSTLRLTLFALATTLVAGCGFQLRGSYALPYESIFIAGPDYSLIVAGLKRAIRSSGSTRLAETAGDAQATFLPTVDAKEPIILSLSSAGRVREKRLRYRYGYRIVDDKGRDLVLPGTVELSRDLTYADSDVLAKTQEEDLLWRDMENDLVQQLMRRLAAVKPMPPMVE